MELLVLGGTSFAGRHVVERALAAGHSVTLFNRGKTNPDLFPAARTLRGDRQTGDYETLKGAGPFDAVVDVCAYVPRAVREAVAALGPTGIAGPYVLISSVSAYAEPPAVDADGELARAGPARPAGFTEDAPLAALPAGVDPASEDVTGETYGPLKVLTEEAAKALLPAGVMIIRPGLIVGPHDPTDRFTYWPVRLARGGEILAPGDGSDPVQFIDARDLAEWTIRLAEQRTIGVFNAGGPAHPITMHQMLAEIAQGLHVDPKIVWAPTPFLKENKVSAWSDMPVWIPGQGETFGFHRRDIRRAIAEGLTYRPLPFTAADTLAWFRTLSAERQAKMRAGLSPEREAELLAKLKA